MIDVRELARFFLSNKSNKELSLTKSWTNSNETVNGLVMIKYINLACTRMVVRTA